MSDEFQDLDGMLGFLGEDGRHRRDPEEHPSPEKLSAYQAGELTPEEDERIQDHLAVCGHCTELLLDLEEFLEPAAAAAEPAADFEAAADWKRLREGMGLVAGKPEPLRANATMQLDYRLVSLRIYRALAAVLGFIVIGLSLYTFRPHSGLEIFPLPQAPIRFDITRSAGQSEDFLKVRLPCTLRFSASPGYPKYRVEIVASRDGRSWYSADTDLADGILSLNARSLPPGDYELQLSGLKDGKLESLGESKKFVVQP